MKLDSKVWRYLRSAILGLGLFLPLLVLIPFGSLWLWENDLLIYWGLAACLTTLAAFLGQKYVLSRLEAASYSEGAVDQAEMPSASWSAPRELAAWEGVLAIAEAVEAKDCNDSTALLNLARSTIESVSKNFHPEVEDPVWQFTVPEALALAERVSARMGYFVSETIPLGDQLTVAQMMMIYRWRTSVDTVRRLYELWRIVRLMNPMTAATQEIRERFSKRLYELGRDELGRRFLKAYVREVGRAAIDLYSGRLRVSPADVGAYTSAETRAQLEVTAQRLSEPLRILVVGQTGVGKSSVVNALLDSVKATVDAIPSTTDFSAYRLDREELSAAILVDTPPLSSEGSGIERIVGATQTADLVLWVISAVRPDRSPDRAAMDAFKNRFEAQPDLQRPPIVVVLTGIDLLRPFREWSPPYDLVERGSPKARSIGLAIGAAAEYFVLDENRIVPVCLKPGSSYNLDALWGKIFDVLPEAQRVRLLRTMRGAQRGWDWRKILQQAEQAGRILSKSDKTTVPSWGAQNQSTDE